MAGGIRSCRGCFQYPPGRQYVFINKIVAYICWRRRKVGGGGGSLDLGNSMISLHGILDHNFLDTNKQDSRLEQF